MINVNDFDFNVDFFQKEDRFQMLAHMVETGLLEIKIVLLSLCCLTVKQLYQPWELWYTPKKKTQCGRQGEELCLKRLYGSANP